MTRQYIRFTPYLVLFLVLPTVLAQSQHLYLDNWMDNCNQTQHRGKLHLAAVFAVFGLYI